MKEKKIHTDTRCLFDRFFVMFFFWRLEILFFLSLSRLFSLSLFHHNSDMDLRAFFPRTLVYARRYLVSFK